jgi:hypothetical protein
MIDPAMNAIGSLMPKCTRALELVELGIERELSAWESIALRYHGNLCLYCSCKRDKFEAKKETMRQAKLERRNLA